jgi:hypothetical protein
VRSKPRAVRVEPTDSPLLSRNRVVAAISSFFSGKRPSCSRMMPRATGSAAASSRTSAWSRPCLVVSLALPLLSVSTVEPAGMVLVTSVGPSGQDLPGES